MNIISASTPVRRHSLSTRARGWWKRPLIVGAVVSIGCFLSGAALAQSFPDPLTNTATVTLPGNTSDPDAGDNTAVDSNALALVSQLALVKTLLTASPVPAGGTVTYSLAVTNSGPSNAIGATVTDAIPAQITGAAWTCAASAPTSNCATASGTGDINVIVDLAVGDTITITVTGTAPLVTPATIDANTATVTPPPGTDDPTPGDNTDTVPPVPVQPNPIVANDDDASGAPVVGHAGGTAVANVLANDSLSGAVPTLGNVVLSVTVPSSNPGVLLNTATGEVTVATGTSTGTYTLTYQICEQLNPANCDTALVTVAVAAAAIDAVDDTAGPVNGSAGGTAVINVLTNDTLNAASVDPADVILTSTNSGPLTINADGTVDVAPNTPAGPYTATYQICEVLNPANCDGATVTVTVNAATIDAVDDDASGTPVSGQAGGTAVANVLANDVFDGIAPTVANVI
ncbi:MAG TPA: hypothetical protein VGC09_10885, partial [Rhodopila sp.]